MTLAEFVHLLQCALFARHLDPRYPLAFGDPVQADDLGERTWWERAELDRAWKDGWIWLEDGRLRPDEAINLRRDSQGPVRRRGGADPRGALVVPRVRDGVVHAPRRLCRGARALHELELVYRGPGQRAAHRAEDAVQLPERLHGGDNRRGLRLRRAAVYLRPGQGAARHRAALLRPTSPPTG